MSNNTEEQITQNVLDSMAQTSNPRLRTVMTSLIRHLHACIHEIELTQEEWALAIDFLTRTGQMCDEKRQEFILLSDVMGVSMLVDAINHRFAGEATESTVFGPFYSDAVFGTKDSLVVDFVRHASAEEAERYHVTAPFYTVEYDFVLKPLW